MFGIRALDSRVSLLQTGHRGIFTIIFFTTKVQKLKFLEYEAEILRNIVATFQSLVHNIFGDMICGS